MTLWGLASAVTRLSTQGAQLLEHIERDLAVQEGWQSVGPEAEIDHEYVPGHH